MASSSLYQDPKTKNKKQKTKKKCANKFEKKIAWETLVFWFLFFGFSDVYQDTKPNKQNQKNKEFCPNKFEEKIAWET